MALLAGIAGTIAQVLGVGSGPYDISDFLGLAIFLVFVVVAAIALLQIYRPIISGFLQGILWLQVPLAAAGSSRQSQCDPRHPVPAASQAC